MLFLYILTVVLPTVTLQCAPHGASEPWTKNVNNHHHHQHTENFYLDNRTIYNKIVEIEKRIDKIEEMENKNGLLGPVKPPMQPPTVPNAPPTVPPTVSPTVPKEEPKEKPDEKPKNGGIPEKEDNGKECLTCPSQLPILESCSTCTEVIVSPPFEYYACKAVKVACGADARKFKISPTFQQIIMQDMFMLECRKGKWVYAASHLEHKVEEISCLKM